MIYLLAVVRVVPGKSGEFAELFEKEMLPAAKAIGWNLVAQWNTSVGTQAEVTDLWAYRDLEDMQRVHDAMAKSLAVPERVCPHRAAHCPRDDQVDGADAELDAEVR